MDKKLAVKIVIAVIIAILIIVIIAMIVGYFSSDNESFKNPFASQQIRRIQEEYSSCINQCKNNAKAEYKRDTFDLGDFLHNHPNLYGIRGANNYDQHYQ